MKKMVQLLTSAMLVAALLTGCGGASGETQTQGAGTADEPLKIQLAHADTRVRMAFIRKWRYCSRGMYPTFPEEPWKLKLSATAAWRRTGSGGGHAAWDHRDGFHSKHGPEQF